MAMLKINDIRKEIQISFMTFLRIGPNRRHGTVTDFYIFHGYFTLTQQI